jgi:hypothetical protein
MVLYHLIISKRDHVMILKDDHYLHAYGMELKINYPLLLLIGSYSPNLVMKFHVLKF